MFIVCLSGSARKFKRGKKLLNCYLSSRAGKFEREAKSCLLFVYPAGPGSSKERQKVVIVCLSVKAVKLNKKSKKLLIVCLSGRAAKFKRKAKSCFVCLFGRAGKIKRKSKSCLLVVYLSRLVSYKERQKSL